MPLKSQLISIEGQAEKPDRAQVNTQGPIKLRTDQQGVPPRATETSKERARPEQIVGSTLPSSQVAIRNGRERKFYCSV